MNLSALFTGITFLAFGLQQTFRQGGDDRVITEDEPDDDDDELSGTTEDIKGGRGKKSTASLTGGKWTTEEDNLLREIVEKHGAKSWKKVASLLGSTRTDVQCLHRWNKVLKVSFNIIACPRSYIIVVSIG